MKKKQQTTGGLEKKIKKGKTIEETHVNFVNWG